MAIRLRYNSPVILTFTLISTAVLVIDSFTAGAASTAFFAVYPGFEAANPLTYLRLFTHVIGHADWTHLMSNFSFILLIGPILEEKYGSLRTLAMMAVTALVTGLLAALVFRTALRGASGVVFMFILLGSFTNTRQGDIPLTFILVVLLFLAREVINAVAVKDNIAQFAHIAGGICGGMFGFAATRSKRRALQGPGAAAALPGSREQPAPEAVLPPEETGRKKGGEEERRELRGPQPLEAALIAGRRTVYLH